MLKKFAIIAAILFAATAYAGPVNSTLEQSSHTRVSKRKPVHAKHAMHTKKKVHKHGKSKAKHRRHRA